MKKNFIIIIFLILFFLHIIADTVDEEDPCKDIDLRKPIKKKKGKIFYAYVRTPYCSNYTYFATDPSFKWSSIDVIATYNVNYDKRISCLAHKHNVRVEFIFEEGHFCREHTIDNDCPYDQDKIKSSLPNIMKKLQENYVDGISLDFEYNPNGNLYGSNGGYASLSKKIREYLDSINENYSLSSALALNPNANLRNQMVDIATYHDYLVVMSYDLYGYTKIGNSVTKSPVTKYSIRENIRAAYMDRLINKTLINKVIVALPLYGYAKRCKKDIIGIFTDNCIIDDEERPMNIGVNTIHHYLNSADHLSAGVFWNEDSKTVYSNFALNGDVYQVVYDNPFSTYLKLKDIGLGGSGVWAIDHLIGLPQPIVEAWYTTFEKINIGDQYIFWPEQFKSTHKMN
ncbi:hypothetical protein DICPUDRAFT_75666 [Dictyostelium purpureum]|uniref:GH18 domain-containing protein n=1 Tax=Dictyostelium purpureum TaxID=5786 RepID=F0ZBB5_DICPU|nr:uncharacterized protein DICPUDRAFT_75666 [Dictyostelium purpureum]EGC38717.1 hypothetical protein DICPUDRAFT_75666 [Dictyostelium purpureum]|eukprot:XP_003284708.1 hypothetical protein DICPUDRAFT_75666 [Dictyostelium purpureum]